MSGKRQKRDVDEGIGENIDARRQTKKAKSNPATGCNPEMNERKETEPARVTQPEIRQRKMNLFVTRKGAPDNPQGEWMVDFFFSPSDKSKMVADTVRAVGLDPRRCQVLIPGVGKSHTAKHLIDQHGICNLSCTDIDRGSLKYQRELLQYVGGRVRIYEDNLMKNEDAKTENLYDVIFDSSVSDVFFAEYGIKRAQANLQKKLSERSVMIIMSMNHKLWLPHLKDFDSFFYSSIEQWSGSKRNPRNARRDVAFIVAVKGLTVDLNKLPTHSLMVQQQNGRPWIQSPPAANMKYVTGSDRK